MLSLILTLAVVGFIVYLIVTYIPMPDAFKSVIIAIVVICLLIWLLGVLGVADLPVPKLR